MTLTKERIEEWKLEVEDGGTEAFNTADLLDLLEQAKKWVEWESRVVTFENRGDLVERILALEAECDEVEQRLGRALGYPAYPEGTPDEGVCVGEHTPGTIAHAAASRIEELVTKCNRLEALVREAAHELVNCESPQMYPHETCGKCRECLWLEKVIKELSRAEEELKGEKRGN